jgi:hypothetical protein
MSWSSPASASGAFGSFTATDVFCVLPYEDPEEADDGWYFGFVEGKPDVKGVFPANFTRPLD